jgi:hypothetical protein
MGRGRARNRGLDALVPTFNQSHFADKYMELVSRGESMAEVADKLGRGYVGQQRKLSVGQMQELIGMIALHGRGSPAFRAWYAEHLGGDPKVAKVIAINDAVRRNPQSLEERVEQLERERDGLVEQLRKQGARHEAEIRAARETAAQDASREAIAERNAALRAKVDAEHARDAAGARADKAEQDLLVMSRRPHADAMAMDAAHETIRDLRERVAGLEETIRKRDETIHKQEETARGMSAVRTRLENKLATITKERDEKDFALKGALARQNAPATAPPRAAPHSPPPEPQPSAPDVMSHLTALVDAGVMTEAEAFARLRRTG